MAAAVSARRIHGVRRSTGRPVPGFVHKHPDVRGTDESHRAVHVLSNVKCVRLKRLFGHVRRVVVLPRIPLR